MVEFQRTEFGGDANFKAAKFEKGVDFREASIYGAMDCSGITFIESAVFVGTTFVGKANFRQSSFHGLADFSGARFKNVAYFHNASFLDKARFSEAKFGGVAIFSIATFGKLAVFDDSMFSSKSSFKRSLFKDAASFDGSELSRVTFENATFQNISFAYAIIGGGSFYDSRIVGVADFIGVHTEWPLSFRDVLFESRATFERAVFGDDVDFTRAIFNDLTTFIETTCWGDLRFDKAILKEWLSFSKADICGVSFDGCLAKETIFFDQTNLERAKLFNAPIESMDFVCCRWPKDENRNTVIFDSLDSPDPAALEDAYRRLKRVAGIAHDMPRMSDWHYQEKLMCLEQIRRRNSGFSRWRNLFSVTWWYWFSSGFGERPIKAFLVLLGLLAVLALGMIYGGVPWKLAIIAAIQHSLFIKSPVFEPVSGRAILFVTLFSKLLIPLQAALFAFALRNKFRR